jgi:hypothetical protein
MNKSINIYAGRLLRVPSARSLTPGGAVRAAGHNVDIGIQDLRCILVMHLLGLAPAVYLAAPDNGPWAGYRGGADKDPLRVTR